MKVGSSLLPSVGRQPAVFVSMLLLIRTNNKNLIPDFPMSASSRRRQQIITSLFFSSPPFIPPIRSASWQFAGLISKQKVLSGKSLRQQTLFGHSDRWGAWGAARSGLLISEL